MKDILQKIPIFSQLSQNEIDQIISFSKIKHLKKGNIIFLKGDSVKFFIALLKGQLKIYKNNSKSDEILIHRFSNPTSIAEMPFFENIPYPASCIAEKESSIILVDAKKFHDFLKENPKLLYKFISTLSQRVKILEERIETISVLSSKDRVKKFIKESGDKFNTMKKIDIAEELNITPEHLSRVLKDIKERGNPSPI